MMAKASTDVTYCVNNKCGKKCWRHVSKHKFDEDKNYRYIKCCEKERENER